MALACVMVEHPWIRIAELREEDATERWEQAHPRMAALVRQRRWLHVQWLLLRKQLVESQRWKAWRAWLGTLSLRYYLLVTRTLRLRPRRRFVGELSTRSLLDELDARALEHSGCIERGDLLELLCGPANSEDSTEQRSALLHGGEEEMTAVDKMV